VGSTASTATAPVALLHAEPAHEFVGERGLAGPAGAGDAQDGNAPARCLVEAFAVVFGEAAGLGDGDGTGEGGAFTSQDGIDVGAPRGEVAVAVADEPVDHTGEAESSAVLGREDQDAGGGQALDLLRHDHPATAAEDAHVFGAGLLERGREVFEVLDVAALVGAHRDSLDILLDRGVDDLAHGAVVPEMDHLGALRLQDPAHDVDRGVVAVEQGGRGDEANRVDGYAEFAGLVRGG